MAFWKLFLVLFHRYSRVFQIPYYLDELKLTRLSLVLHIEGTHYMRQYTYGTKVHFFTIRVEGGRTIQGEILIEKSALTRQYSKVLIWSNYLQLIKSTDVWGLNSDWPWVSTSGTPYTIFGFLFSNKLLNLHYEYMSWNSQYWEVC